MPVGAKVDLGSGHTVRWGPRQLPQKWAHPAIFGPCLLWPVELAALHVAAKNIITGTQ